MSIPIPRELDVDLTEVPRHWMANNAVATAISNGINLLFPHGERFFVRSVHHYMDRIDDPQLREQVKAFFKQEGHHAKAHDELNRVLRAQGFAIDRFLGRYKAFLDWMEARMPAKLNLAGTAAAEHYTAILAHGAFTRGMLEQAEPTMQQLLEWHAAEELEHKAVAFDVLHAIASPTDVGRSALPEGVRRLIDSSYLWRIAGLAYATVMLGMIWCWATTVLLRQEKLGWREIRRQLGLMRQRDPIIRRVFVAGIRKYIRRDFHPSQTADEHLAAAWFAARGLPFTAQQPEVA